MAKFHPSGGLIERLYWLIRLRWIAVIGILLASSFSKQVLKIPLPVFPLYSVAILLAIYNLLFLFYLDRINRRNLTNLPVIANRFANVQISLDLTSLAILIHFSGGIENPFIFYFIFHMIIASILLTRRASFLQATFAIFLLLLIVLLEYLGRLAHYCLENFISYSLHSNLLYILGVSFVFISTLYIAVYMATSISARLRERERSLKQANELLREKDRIKSEYVLRVSHDIKEDLSAIQSCIEPVTEGITGPLNPKQADLLRRAKERSGKLISFVNALLEITKMKLTRELKMEEFSLIDAIKSVSQNIDSRAKAKGLKFNVNIAAGIDKIKGVRVYIEEAILNLLANSVKYTPKGGSLALEVKSKEDNVLFVIRDTGIGIPQDEIAHVFDEFYRAGNARMVERQGTGLGLSITKQIVQMHKGRIWVQSKEGEGAIFYVELPK
jgi:signal transduction histidine kinase